MRAKKIEVKDMLLTTLAAVFGTASIILIIILIMHRKDTESYFPLGGGSFAFMGLAWVTSRYLPGSKVGQRSQDPVLKMHQIRKWD